MNSLSSIAQAFTPYSTLGLLVGCGALTLIAYKVHQTITRLQNNLGKLKTENQTLFTINRDLVGKNRILSEDLGRSRGREGALYQTFLEIKGENESLKRSNHTLEMDMHRLQGDFEDLIQDLNDTEEDLQMAQEGLDRWENLYNHSGIFGEVPN